MGVIFTDEAGDRIASAVRWVESNRGAGAAQAGQAAREELFTVRAESSAANGDGYYAGIITRLVDGAWSDYSGVLIRPRNTGDVVTSGVRYDCRPAGFSGSVQLFVIAGALPPGGTLIVRDVAVVNAVAGVTIAEFDQADGFVVSNPSGTTVRVDLTPATASQAGGVSTTTQTIGGAKTFTDAVTLLTSPLNLDVNTQELSGQLIHAHSTAANGTSHLELAHRRNAGASHTTKGYFGSVLTYDVGGNPDHMDWFCLFNNGPSFQIHHDSAGSYFTIANGNDSFGVSVGGGAVAITLQISGSALNLDTGTY